MIQPKLISLSKFGEDSQGYLAVLEGEKNLPFIIKRAFITHRTPEEIVRGRHAHFETEMILMAISGRIIVNTEMPDGKQNCFTLDQPDVGVYLPKLCWHTMLYQNNAIQLVLASTEYEEKDYIRDYNEYLKLKL